MVGFDEAATGEESHKEEDYERIADGNGKARNHVMPQASPLAAGLVWRRRLDVIGISPEAEEEDAANQLEIEHCCGTPNEVHHEAHAQTCHHGIEEVAHCGTDARGKAIPAPLVKGTLNGKHSDGSHRRTCYNSHHHTSHCKVDGVNGFKPQQAYLRFDDLRFILLSGCKDTKKRLKIKDLALKF